MKELRRGRARSSAPASHTYDPFGAPDSAPANTTIHRFVGRWNKQYDTTSGLILMGARPYDPNTGRFLSVDPIPGGSLNNYDYAGQDPINNYDLSGTVIQGDEVGSYVNPTCLTTGCGMVPGGFPNEQTSWGRLGLAAAQVVLLVATDGLGNAADAGELLGAAEQGAGTTEIRGLVETAARGSRRARITALRSLGAVLLRAGTAANMDFTASGMTTAQMIQEFVVKMVAHLLKGY